MARQRFLGVASGGSRLINVNEGEWI